MSIVNQEVFILCTSEDDIVNGNFLWLSPVYISLVAKTFHKTAVVYANSNTKNSNIVWIWRLKSRMLWRILARYFLNKMDLVTTRDKRTFEFYKSFTGDDIPIYFTGDVGVLLEPIDLSATKRIMIKEKVDRSDGLLMGAAISRRLLLHAFQECSEPEEKYEKGIIKIAAVFDKLVTEYRLKIVFLPSCIEFYRDNDDRLVGYDILRKMKNKDRFNVVSNEYTPQELKGLIGQFDIFLGDRTHALISALSMGVPCCAMAYRSDRRPYNLIGEGFDQRKWIFEVETFEADRLFQLLTELITVSAEIKENLPPIIQRAKKWALLNGQLLKKLLVTKRKYQQTHICAFDCEPYKTRKVYQSCT